MSPSFLGDALRDRYLRMLGVERTPPGLDALTELVGAHLARVPFENVSKLYHVKHGGVKGLPDLETFLDGVERSGFGGTCYALNGYLNSLLKSLGYDAVLCGADMARPDVHAVNMVTVEGREYLVDVGYAAPFFAPVPRDIHRDVEVVLGGDTYLFRPRDGEGKTKLDLFRSGERIHGYVAKPAPRRIEEFDGAIADSYATTATFMNALLLVGFFREGFIRVHNLSVVLWRDGVASRRKLRDLRELAGVVEGAFGISRSVVEEVASELPMDRDAWS